MLSGETGETLKENVHNDLRWEGKAVGLGLALDRNTSEFCTDWLEVSLNRLDLERSMLEWPEKDLVAMRAGIVATETMKVSIPIPQQILRLGINESGRAIDPANFCQIFSKTTDRPATK